MTQLLLWNKTNYDKGVGYNPKKHRRLQHWHKWFYLLAQWKTWEEPLRYKVVSIKGLKSSVGCSKCWRSFLKAHILFGYFFNYHHPTFLHIFLNIPCIWSHLTPVDPIDLLILGWCHMILWKLIKLVSILYHMLWKILPLWQSCQYLLTLVRNSIPIWNMTRFLFPHGLPLRLFHVTPLMKNLLRKSTWRSWIFPMIILGRLCLFFPLVSLIRKR